MQKALVLTISLAIVLGCFAGLNPVNPNFDYPESQQLDKQKADIPYQGDIWDGYITVNTSTESKIFYLLYSAGGSNSPTTINNTKPLILWLQGGPGCADGAGNYLEIGPFNVKNVSGNLVPTLNDVTWNDEYNLLFVDSPIGVGFSVSGGERPDNAWSTAEYLQVFLIRFFQVYPNLYQNDFYIFGESFGGHYIPALATIITQNNTENGIKLRGIGIGDGWTDPYTQVAVFSDYCFSTGLLDEHQRDLIHEMELKAQSFIASGDYSSGSQWFDYITGNITELNANVDIFNFQVYNLPDVFPYDDWLQLENTKAAYGVDPNVTFQDCVDQTYLDFYPDIALSYAQNYSYLLTQAAIPDLKIMLYSGQNDIICNTIGTLTYAPNLNWLPIKLWEVTPRSALKNDDGTVVGFYKAYKQFSFGLLYDAGHMAPWDQPESARILLRKFIENSFEQEEEEVLMEMLKETSPEVVEMLISQ